MPDMLSNEERDQIVGEIIPMVLKWIPESNNDVSVVSESGGLELNQILLIHDDSSPTTSYPNDDDGLLAALAAAASGDIVIKPNGTITGGPWTVPAGVEVIGLSRIGSVLVGTVTLGAGAGLENLTVTAAANDANPLTAITGPGSDTAWIYRCTVSAAQSGSGAAYGVRAAAGGTLRVESCKISGTSIGGSGYGGSDGGGTLTAIGGEISGSTARFAFGAGTINVSGSTGTPLASEVPSASDRAAWNAANYASRHTNDSDTAGGIHHTLGTGAAQAAAGNHTHSQYMLATNAPTVLSIPLAGWFVQGTVYSINANGLRAAFRKGYQDTIDTTLVMPPGWRNKTLYAELWWYTTVAGNVAWGAEIRYMVDGGAVAATADLANNGAVAAQNVIRKASINLSTLDPGNDQAGLALRIWRNGTTSPSDTANGTAYLLAVQLRVV